jgi:hypothetical protein
VPEPLDPEIAANLRQSLRQYAELGADVEIIGGADPCPACGAAMGRRYQPAAAPEIPIPGCSNEICRCDYTPVLDE